MTAQWLHDKIRRAEAEAAAGRKWRAKEMLRGSLASTTYALHPDLLEAYGRLLDSLGDRCDAGKYLFLSGVRRPEYDEAISVFLDRFSHTHVNDLVAQFPNSIRQAGLGHLPANVREELERLGAAHSELDRTGPLPPGAPGTQLSSWRDTTLMVGCLAFVVAFVVFAIIGLVTIIRWLAQGAVA